MNLKEKTEHAANVLRVAVKLSKTYYNKPIVICYSGGKDSDVMLDIAIKTLKPEDFRVLNSHTTLDAPETVYFIREKFAELRAQGYTCDISYPMYKGKRDSFWRLCERRKMLPTRLTRFCCAVLKEVSTPNQIACVGVRSSESKNREGRNEFGLRGDRNVAKTAQHVNAMIEFDKDPANPSSFECEIIKGAKDNKAIMCNPIYDFEETDVWQYAKENNIRLNPLYWRGYKRVGCVGCPMAGKGRYKEFADYPKYRENMIRLCDRIVPIMDNNNKNFETGEDMFRWWMEEDFRQLRIEDITKEGRQ